MSAGAAQEEALVEMTGVAKAYAARRGAIMGQQFRRIAVDDVALRVRLGETLGIVGESGSGKSTLARLMAGLIRPDTGIIRVDGLDPAARRGRLQRRIAERVQMVFQDPYSSLNPRLRVGDSIMEPLMSAGGLSRRQARARAVEALSKVGMPAASFARYPHEFSGGQRQRICIARALVLKPKLVILDEAVSALDVSIKSQILNLLNDLQEEFRATFVFISHDLAITRQFCGRIAVMLRGQIVETGPSRRILEAPLHPYTRLLIRSIPRRTGFAVDADRGAEESADTSIASAGGCPFLQRCRLATEICRTVRPQLADAGADGRVACHATGPASARPTSPESPRTVL